MVNIALVAAVAIACSSSVVDYLQVELDSSALRIPALDVKCPLPRHINAHNLQAQLEAAVDTSQPLELASPFLVVDGTLLNCDTDYDPCAVYDSPIFEAFELLANNDTMPTKKKNSESKADKEPFYCGGEQFELIDDSDDPDERYFGYIKVSIVELFLAFVAVLLEQNQVLLKKSSALEMVGRLGTTAGHWYYVSRVVIKYFTLLFHGEIDYFCHTLGVFSYRAIWMISNYAMNTVVLYLLTKNADSGDGKVMEYFYAGLTVISAVVGAAFALMWVVGLPVILFLLFVNVTTFIVFLPWFIAFMVINLFPLHLICVGGAVGLAALTGKELNTEPKGFGAVGLVRAAILILMIPTFVWYNFGYFAVEDAYNKTPSFLLRLFKADSKILGDLTFNFSGIESYVDPGIVNLALLRFGTDYIGILALVRFDWIAQLFTCKQSTCNASKAASKHGAKSSTESPAAIEAPPTADTATEVELA